MDRCNIIYLKASASKYKKQCIGLVFVKECNAYFYVVCNCHDELNFYTINTQMCLTAFFNERVKPIFHCDAKYLAPGVGVGQCPRRENFALEIPTCWYILALPNAKI